MTKDPGIHPPPKVCDCGKPVVIVQLEVVYTTSGKIRRGAFSEFGEMSGKARILQPHFGFKRWIGECADCYYSGQGQEEIFG